MGADLATMMRQRGDGFSESSGDRRGGMQSGVKLQAIDDLADHLAFGTRRKTREAKICAGARPPRVELHDLSDFIP